MGLRGPKPKLEREWYKQVAALMTNEFMRFSPACQALGVKFTSAEDEREHEFSPAFRAVLSGLHLELFVELGSDPRIGKEYVKGVAVKTIQKLEESDQWDKVTAPLKELSDVLGLTRETEDKKVLFNLTQEDIDKARAELKAKEEEAKTSETVDAKPN